VVQIYRGLVGSDKEIVTDASPRCHARLDPVAVRSPDRQRSGAAPDRSTLRFGSAQVPRGRLVIVQRADAQFSSEHIGSVSTGADITKAIIACSVDSTIEFFNRMFAHSLGGYVVSSSTESILNPAGRATPSDRDALAATFMYSRTAGNLAPDQDPSGVFFNA
jgi:hypothetical protein